MTMDGEVLGGKVRGRLEHRFWGKVAKAEPDACWPWTGSRSRKGYGYFLIGSRVDGSRRTVRAHRLAYELANGPIPAGLFACHRCDNPPCCNPTHLFVGTHDENVTDAVRKGRIANTRARGERNGRAHLMETAIVEIRRRYAAGETQVALAREFGIGQSKISEIVLRKSWKHVA